MPLLPNLGLLWPLLLYALRLVQATEDDLLDFDFSDVKEIDWNYDAARSPSTDRPPTSNLQKQEIMTDVHVVNDLKQNQVNAFNWYDQVLRKALAKAVTNKSQRQKFLEILPILRVLSKQQKLTLSALIAAQINAKKGQELKLEQVRHMFGDDKKLLIPIVYDIANLVRNSAKKYIRFNHDKMDLEDFSKFSSNRRHMELSSVELDDEDEDVGTIEISEPTGFLGSDDSMEDFFADMTPDVLDPKRINEELQSMTVREAIKHVNTSKEESKQNAKRLKRSVETKEFVHKLIRSIPSSINEEDLLRAAATRSLKLNTTLFSTSKAQNRTAADSNSRQSTHNSRKNENPNKTPDQKEAYQFIEDLALASLNETFYPPPSEKVVGTANITENAETLAENKSDDEKLPTPEELIGGPRVRVRKILPPTASKITSNKRKRMPARKKPKPDIDAVVPPPRNCERFTASMCIKTDDYPFDQIMGSIRRHRNAMVALLAEYNDKWNSIDANEEFNEYTVNKKRREDEQQVSGNGMCQSIVRYARPQKARSASGEWKYIINTGQHTQTLRLEKCSHPQESCSYLNQNYRSHCAQVYNYHRLLSWDKNRGLHVDIFKVPTCCSCQIDGYRAKFPIFTEAKKEYTPIYNEDFYQKELDYNDDMEEDEDEFGYDYHKHDSSFDAKELLLGSKKIRKKVPKPTVGAYLSPPDRELHEQKYAYEPTHDIASAVVQPSLASSSSSNFLRDLARRRPFKGYSNEARADQDFAPSEQLHFGETEHTAASVVAPPPAIVVGSPVSALHPSPPAPEPFVPSPPHPRSQSQSVTTALIPMPTKNYLQKQQHLQELQQEMEQQQQQQQQQHQQQQSIPHHYRPSTLRPDPQTFDYQTEKSLNTNHIFAPRIRSRPHSPPIKRPTYQQLKQHQQQQRLRHPIRPINNLRRHRSGRTYYL